VPDPSPSTPPDTPAEAARPSSPAVPEAPDAAVLDAEIVETDARPDTPPDPSHAGEAATAIPDYDEHGVPGFDYVRDKIEQRYATAIGTTELTADTPEARTVEDQLAERERAARARLEEIRRSMRG
jgi:hypothetical protein